MTQTRPRQTFVWQGALILLPLALLVVFGLWTARHDRLYAEQESKRSAEVDAQLIAQDISQKLSEALSDNHWAFMSAWRSGEFGQYTNRVVPSASGVHVKAPFYNSAIDSSRKNDIGFYSDSPVRVGASGELFAQEGEILASLWDSSFKGPVELGNPFEPIAKLRQEKQFDLTRQKLEALIVKTNAQLASGIPVCPSALLQLAELSMEEARTNSAAQARHYLEAAGLQALLLVSDFTPTILDRATALHQQWFPNHSPPPVWKERWRARENLAALLAPLRIALGRKPEIAKSLWTYREEVPWLVTSTPIPNASENHLPSLADVCLFPEPVVQEAVFDSVLLSKRELPPYQGIRISIAGRSLVCLTNMLSGVYHQPGIAVFPTNAMELAQAEVSWLGHASRSTLPHLQVSIVISDSALWSRQMQKRQLWLVGIILAAGLASLAGLLSARRAFQQQQRLNEAQSNFVSSVSHELRAPIASVRLMAESLEREKITDPARRQEYFRFIVQECRRLSTLIENVLDLSRMDQDRKQYHFEPCDLALLVEQTVQVMIPCAVEKGVLLLCETSDEPPAPLALFDGPALQQALINLMDNAIKHSPQNSEVNVSLQYSNGASAKPSSALIAVRDSGPGIAESEQKRIFEKFYRLGSELRRETQGIGIGLSIVKHVAEAHGGRVTVKSKPGEGAVFVIILPLRNQQETTETNKA